MFNRDVFYRQLDEVYERRDLDAIERFLLDTQRRLSEERAYNTPSCDLCITPADRIALNSGYVKNLLTVQNELLSLYRGINRFEECLRISSAMKEEMEDLGLKKTDQYAILLLNEGTAYRMMGRMEDALADFDEFDTILQNCRRAAGTGGYQTSPFLSHLQRYSECPAEPVLCHCAANECRRCRSGDDLEPGRQCLSGSFLSYPDRRTASSFRQEAVP